jgi:hypothetical protein
LFAFVKWKIATSSYSLPERVAPTHAPTNKAGVIFLFGAVAAELGFRVERMQTAFPDCEAKREIVPGKWERVRIEFEFESLNFKEHRHDPEGCDVIVCWRITGRIVRRGLT